MAKHQPTLPKQTFPFSVRPKGGDMFNLENSSPNFKGFSTQREMNRPITENNDPKVVDWEQRRYELVKSLVAGAATSDFQPHKMAEDACEYADAIIALLMRKDLRVSEKDKEMAQILFAPLSTTMYLSLRAANALCGCGIKNLYELLVQCSSKAKLCHYRNIGRKTLDDVDNILKSYGLCWGMDVSRYKTIYKNLLFEQSNK